MRAIIRAFGVFARFGAVRRAFCRRMRGAFRVCIGFGVELLRYGRATVFIAEKRRGGKENIHGVFGAFLFFGVHVAVSRRFKCM